MRKIALPVECAEHVRDSMGSGCCIRLFANYAFRMLANGFYSIPGIQAETGVLHRCERPPVIPFVLVVVVSSL